jgi:hypothetical protein
MKLLVFISDEVQIEAFRQARELGKHGPLPAQGLPASLDAETESWIERLWDAMEGALRRAYFDGLPAARPLIEAVAGLMTELTRTLAKQAEDVRTVITARLNTYLHTVIDEALQRVRPTLSVGGRALQLTRVTVEQQITLSGSLQAWLAEICEFVAAGEIAFSAEYSETGST